MDELIKKASLDRREAALASRICLGVIQNSSLCSYYVDCYSTVRADKLEPRVLDILNMGIYQILFMNIPDRAAVSESVTLCKESGLQRASGLVNAVLRRVAENAESLPPIPGSGSAEHLAIKYSHSLWLVQRLITQYGYDKTEQFLASNNETAPLCIQVNTLKCSREGYEEQLSCQGIPFRTHPWLKGCILLTGYPVHTLPGYEEGLFYVQDAAARTAAELSGAEKGMRVLDACAAPGGKSFAAAIRMQNVGSILSCDIHEKKLRLVQQGAARLGISILKTQTSDARVCRFAPEEYFDLVIADVPCSGIGVIRKKPEIRWKREEECAALPKIQSDILDNLAQWVKPGGSLLYSTCTVLKEENEEQIQSFLTRRPDYRLASFSLGDREIREGMYCFWPDCDGTDGFFAAKLMRIK